MIENTETAVMVQNREVGNMLAVIDRAARDPNIDVEKMERLLALAEQIHARESKAAYDQAINDAQSEMRPISRDCHNPQTRSRYASYEQIDNAIRPIYTRHGFAMSFGSRASASPDRVIVTCRISHKLGHTELVELEMPADGKGAKGGDVMTKTHATGSALSYGKRYIANLVWNLSFGESDDDGNAAGGRAQTRQQANRSPEPTGEPKRREQATTAQIVPKMATDATRAWMLGEIEVRELMDAAHTFAVQNGWLKKDQNFEEWPLERVPTSKAALAALLKEIEKFADANTPPSEQEETGLPPEIANAIITVPRRGMKRKDYLENPDTVGSLYAAAKDGDGDARNRLFGLALEWECKPYEGSDGKTYQPSAEDVRCRKALDAFLDYREARGEKD